MRSLVSSGGVSWLHSLTGVRGLSSVNTKKHRRKRKRNQKMEDIETEQVLPFCLSRWWMVLYTSRVWRQIHSSASSFKFTCHPREHWRHLLTEERRNNYSYKERYILSGLPDAREFTLVTIVFIQHLSHDIAI